MQVMALFQLRNSGSSFACNYMRVHILRNTSCIALTLYSTFSNHHTNFNNEERLLFPAYNANYGPILLEILVKVLRATTLREHLSVTTQCIALKLY